ncbi:DUF4304 domain-containing protein [Paenibacillus sp. MMS20-IR301]|uniref:DUF4304 domain-containing protein n=1 Tax=Paenibacillus sp. MMS20-IR301 TaxID=2895946 RepID=UPI0028E6E505|nr:DUF4304 domain-containing protein [Paenibacillus sp. MMS20-IR301]WNS41485.1 DUF4304 domain-containing protein [Paenibacillus sp. MMS20-IR301]
MQQLFKELIKNEVKPFFAGHGYSKKNLFFYKAEGTQFYSFQLQKLAGNTRNQIMFYVNCCIYSIGLEPFQARPTKTAPPGENPHFTVRIAEIVPAAPDRYSLTSDTDADKFTAELLQHLEEALMFMHTMTGAREIVDYYMDRTALHLSEETFRFLLHAGDRETADQYLLKLRAKYGSEPRWTIWEKKYAAIWSESEE